jgi:phosphoglycerate dehydrogenase-like enzyme
MQRTAYLINTSRGPIIEEQALIQALQQGTIAGAGLDVFDEEPLPLDHPFRRLENTVITPHLGYVTLETYRIFFGDAVEDIRAFLSGTPTRVINVPQRISSDWRRSSRASYFMLSLVCSLRYL